MTGEQTALAEHSANELAGALQGDVATLKGEAEELAHRRPHPDAHLYDIEEQLRWRAEQSQEALELWYYE